MRMHKDIRYTLTLRIDLSGVTSTNWHDFDLFSILRINCISLESGEHMAKDTS